MNKLLQKRHNIRTRTLNDLVVCNEIIRYDDSHDAGIKCYVCDSSKAFDSVDHNILLTI